MAYKIIRNYFDSRYKPRTIKTVATLEEAQAHCSDPETSSTTAKSAKARNRTEARGPWFDGYTKVK